MRLPCKVRRGVIAAARQAPIAQHDSRVQVCNMQFGCEKMLPRQFAITDPYSRVDTTCFSGAPDVRCEVAIHNLDDD